MYYHICNEVNVRNYDLKGKKSILIRALNSSYRENGVPYQIENIDDYSAVLELYLDDTPNEKYITLNSFNIDKALELNNFILENDFDEIVIHCTLGISRSPALMICVAKILGNEKLEEIIKHNYSLYNKFITQVFDCFNYTKKELFNNNVCGNVIKKEKVKDYLVEEEPGVYVLRLK